jgi:hypothetical protein
MSTRYKFAQLAGIAALCLGVCGVAPASADSAHTQRKPAAKKLPPQPLPPLPSGPTGPVPQMPLDSIAPVPPQVSYQNGQLTIVAPNSTLSDILRAVRKQTGAEIEIPTASDRVVTHLGPGPAQEVMAELLNGSRFNYVLLGSPEKADVLTRIVLVAKTGAAAGNATASNAPGPQPVDQAANVDPQDATDTAEPDPPEENQDESAEQAAAEAEQPAAPTADQPETKTPQQMLQEMQQRQLQLQQQQQQTGQPPAPGAITTPRSPQEPQ